MLEAKIYRIPDLPLPYTNAFCVSTEALSRAMDFTCEIQEVNRGQSMLPPPLGNTEQTASRDEASQ